MHEYAGQARSTKWARDLLIVAIGSATPFGLPPLRHRQRTDEGCVMTDNHALNLSYHDGLRGN